jgi:uncharacterized membrane protein YdcZ (DUF606 family)
VCPKYSLQGVVSSGSHDGSRIGAGNMMVLVMVGQIVTVMLLNRLG